jgi:hypothetical protein
MFRLDKPSEARDLWRRALTIFTELGAPQIDDVTSRLRGLPDEG